MTCLYLAAGGGGDALAAAIVHRALGHTEPAVIATYAWDRLWIDPLPGPRTPADFQGLRPIGRHNHVITPRTEARPPSGSTLPRLASDLDDTLVLLDPHAGAVGMRAQLQELIRLNTTDSVAVLDVGGDAVARGDEPGLRSPLADALALAAAIELDLDVTVIIAGPGLDGELTEKEVLAVTGDEPAGRIGRGNVEQFRAALDWHPSEATAVLAAAARGVRGRVEIRDAGLPVELTDRSANVHRLDLADVVDVNVLAADLGGTTSLIGAENIARAVCGFSEIDYEREKASRSRGWRRRIKDEELLAAIQSFEQVAAGRGVNYATVRRMAEATGATPSAIRAFTQGESTLDPAWPLHTLKSYASAPASITARRAHELLAAIDDTTGGRHGRN